MMTQTLRDSANDVIKRTKAMHLRGERVPDVLSGGMSAGSNETEPCPNGCGPLWPMTWRQQAEELQERCEEQMARAVAAENALRYARPLVEKWCHYQGDNAAFRAETLAPIDAALNGPTKEDQP